MFDDDPATWRMSSPLRSLLLTFLLFAGSAGRIGAWFQSSTLVVRGAAGSVVTVDGVASGEIDETGVLRIALTPGDKDVVVEPFGYHPVESVVTVEPASATEFEVPEYELRVRTWLGDEASAPEIRDRTWRIEVRTAAEDCEVECYELGWESVALGSDRTTRRWVARGAAEGPFRLRFAAGYESVEHEVRPVVGETLFLSVDAAGGRVLVDRGDVAVDAPAGVEVTVDGEPVALDAGVLRDVAPGEREVVVSMPDHHPYRAVVRVTPGGVARVECPPLRPRLVIVGDGPAPELDPARAALVLQSDGAFQVDCASLGLTGLRVRSSCGIYAIPPGRHVLLLRSGDHRVEHEVALAAGRRVRLSVDPANGEVERVPPTSEDLALAFRADGERGYVVAMAVDRAGELLVAARRREREIDVWSLVDGRVTATMPTDQEVAGLALVDDDATIVAMHASDAVSVYDREHGHRVGRFETGGSFNVDLAVDASRGHVWTATYSGITATIRRTDLATLSTVAEIEIPGIPVSLALAPDGNTLVVAMKDGARRIDASAPESPRAVGPLPLVASFVSYSPRGDRLAAVTSGAVAVLDTKTWSEVSRLEGDGGTIRGIAWDAEGAFLAVSRRDVELWDPRAGRRVRTLRTDASLLSCLAFSPGAVALVAAADSRSVMTWRAE